MNKQQIFNETKAYEEREKFSLREIYSTCAQTFSSFRTIRKSKEYGLPEEKYDKCGIIPKLGVIWYAYNYRLSLYHYESNEHEQISTFNSNVLFVDIFVPKKGIFNSKILYCFIVFTESQVIIYGIDRNSYALINTNFVASTYSKILSYCLNNGSIFIGCEDGNIYEVIYKSLDSWSFKIMYLYSPNTSLITNFVPSLFRKKKPKIVAMSTNSKYLITLSKNISLYNIEGGIFKVKDITIYKEYVDVQIIEEKYGEIFFYCVLPDGTRDFYDTKHLFTKNCFIDDLEKENLRLRTYDKRFLIIQKNRYQGTLIHFVSFNDFQNSNIDRNKSSENQELISLTDGVLECFIEENTLFLITNMKIIFYEILDLKRFVAVSRVEEVYNLFKNLGQREGLALYFELYSLNCDISKLEYLCVKIDEIHIKGLFSFIYRNLRSFLNVKIYKILEDENLKIEMDKTVHKFKNLISKMKQGEYFQGVSFMRYFNQTVFYIYLLAEYGIDLQDKTFCQLILDEELDFKKKSLDSLMEIYKTNQCLDSLINLLTNRAPEYLPINEIYYHQGFDLLKKYPSKEKLYDSLKNFKNLPIKEDIIIKYNELKFYVGLVILLRKHFNYEHEDTVKYLQTAVKCNGSISCGLEDKREEFLYAFFDALISNLLLGEMKTECVCCDTKISFKLSEIIKLESKFLGKYLEEKSESNNNSLVYELYWKYCAYRDERVQAVKSLLYLIDYKSISLEKRIDLLQKAKTVSLHTSYQENVKRRSNLLEVQLELLERGEDSKPIKISLLPADILFNDYAYKYPDLALKIIDQYTFKNESIIKELLIKGMDGNFNSSVNFLKKNKYTNLDCKIVGEILLDKMSKDDKLTKTLLDIGFTYQEVQKFVEYKIKTEDDTEFRSFLIEDFKLGCNDKEYCKKLGQYCIAKN